MKLTSSQGTTPETHRKLHYRTWNHYQPLPTPPSTPPPPASCCSYSSYSSFLLLFSPLLFLPFHVLLLLFLLHFFPLPLPPHQIFTFTIPNTIRSHQHSPSILRRPFIPSVFSFYNLHDLPFHSSLSPHHSFFFFVIFPSLMHFGIQIKKMRNN